MWYNIGVGTRFNPDRKLKSCGKRHAYCKVCKPSINISAMSPKGRRHKEGCRCNSHTRIQWGHYSPSWKGGPGYKWKGKGWGEAREIIWKRDTRCRACGGLPNPDRRLDVHHITSRREGGTNKLKNLIGLHHGCHMKIHYGTLAPVV